MSRSPLVDKIKKEIEIEFARSSGPGGQNVNKTSTKAVLRWRLDESNSLTEMQKKRLRARWSHRLTRHNELILSSQKYRHQKRNIADCLAKFSEMLESGLRPTKKRQLTKVPDWQLQKRRHEKRRQKQKKNRRQPVKTTEE